MQSLQSTNAISISLSTETASFPSTTITEQAFTTQTIAAATTAAAITTPPPLFFSTSTTATLAQQQNATSSVPLIAFSGAAVPHADLNPRFAMSAAGVLGFLAWFL
jgi:hypothetical protein